jgi:hypothetical protein
MPLSRELLFFKDSDLAQRAEALVLGGVAVGRGFEPHSDLELFSAKIFKKRTVMSTFIEAKTKIKTI